MEKRINGRRSWCPFYVALFIVGITIFLSAASLAQEKKAGDIILPAVGSGRVDAYIEALKSDIRSHTREIMRVNLPLTEKETAAFWPIYDRYDYDVGKLNYERSSIYNFYADNYRTLSDKQAENLLKRLNYVDRRMLALNEKYGREMAKVLHMRTVLRFFQIASQVDLLLRLKIMAGMPLVPTDKP